MDKPKPKLTDEQRQILRAAAVAHTRDLLNRREEMQDKARTMRALWQALLEAPQWSIAHTEKPADAKTFDEVWSMTPIVHKR